jgi:putative transposase
LGNVKRFAWNHERVYRIYRELELNQRIKPSKRIVRDKPDALVVPDAINQVWSMDFMPDRLEDGRALRVFNVIDDFNREALAIEADSSLPSERVIRILSNVIAWRGNPAAIRCDNGPENIRQLISDWAEEHHIKLSYTSQGTRRKTPTWSASTAPCATNGSRNIVGRTSRKFKISLRSGCGPTITTVLTWPYVV